MASKHTTARGETLSGIAQDYYGDASLYPIIALVNKIANPDIIRVGQVLIIPDIGPDAPRHRVISGDTLSKLARRYYGDATLYDVIAIANSISNPDRIDVGEVLIIPDIT
ncbi:LysM peptidoglycan-binding domain-containing protein [Rhodococcus sp. T2V]|uniref:LysM peptidoglycan-binding domain-containing protein n=1 Tax=Rhodococcus sp. T2V TaxID=3034164 RepID=UPI0023E158B8|nr:LysM peptidoglycan-binding domain-containing protein [Rhodococcus sp. T2V]MDF3311618.1 LysM peptidoglycan-binding domain-containing protein [Rhodococcus sp. T2V]